jgi:hypothetical protein
LSQPSFVQKGRIVDFVHVTGIPKTRLVLGLRFTPPNNALTTIPALANVGTSGGSIAHLASGGDGWQTTFVLVNTGTSTAQATLSFFNDVTGLHLSLPLSFPQSGGGNVTMSPSVTQTLAAGATLLIVSSGAPQLQRVINLAKDMLVVIVSDRERVKE